MTSLSRCTNVLVGVLTLIVCAFVPAISATGGEYYSLEVEVCNNGGQSIWVAIADKIESSWLSPDIWRVKGWKIVSSKDCVEVYFNDSHSLPHLAFSQVGKNGKDGIATYSPTESLFGFDHIISVSRQFCVHPTHNFDYEFSGDNMENCEPPFELAEFSIMVIGAYRRDSTITVNIDPSKAALVTPFSSPPSAAAAPKKKAKPEPNLLTELFNAYKEAWEEERRASRERPVDPPKPERPVDSPKQQADVDAVLALAQVLAAQGNPQSDHPKQPHAPPKPGWLGITVQDIPPELAERLKFKGKVVSGVLVSAVTPDGPAAHACEFFGGKSDAVVLPGDVITNLTYSSGAGSLVFHDTKQLIGLLQGVKSGDVVTLSIWRQGKPLLLCFVARERPTEKE
ncbi:MAG: PDZ domain-containing protein [Nitrospira sp.]|nr:PDZ domain-containing protein [Nitrospira sp.]